MDKIVFATNNTHKLEEVSAILKDKMQVLSLQEIGCTDDIAETAETLEGNAEIKARYVFERFQVECFADDTGLEVEALGGKPGVHSARYAGEPSDSARNVVKLLAEMKDKPNRKACFRTVICLIEEGNCRFFEGKIKGEIALTPSGKGGFGYDPVFIPEGYDRSFAELTSEEKNSISHRALAVKRLDEYLSLRF